MLGLMIHNAVCLDPLVFHNVCSDHTAVAVGISIYARTSQKSA